MVKPALASVFVCGMCLVGAPVYSATEEESALKLIGEFSDKICGEYHREGGGQSLEISGSAKVELVGILRKLGDLGLDGNASYTDDEYVGVLRSELAEELKDQRNCKLRVFEHLKNDLLPTVGTVCPTGRLPVPSTALSTNSSDVSVLGDTEIDSDDWTSVRFSYEISSKPDLVAIDVTWVAQERNGDRTAADTRFTSTKSIPVYSILDICRHTQVTQVDGLVRSGSKEQYYRDELRGFQEFPNVGSVQSLRFQVDAAGREDHRVQAMEGTLSSFSVVVGSRQ